jgi:hypothetical protein
MIHDAAATNQQTNSCLGRVFALILTSQDAGWDMLVMLSCSKVASNVLMLGSMDKELSTPFSHSQTY